ncbi:ABC transporter permease [Rhodopseudomonas palustris]|jgi:ABC-type dipeptide/oligopeptide/nickel transport system permease component|uniref:ABC transporter permease n=1 Tax=Rhodopseudomonas palustris TaxID=1076 RepID=UPI0020CC0668|nr:ABC transporter permease [Rhodopseudomonas palustris]MCP9627470.1 ABC transporter permease [Rhodopseudomonas palustris]
MLILEFLIKRILQGFLIIGITSFIIFTLLRVVPGDPVRLIVGGMAPADVVEKVATKMGLRDPIIVQYGRYMVGLLQGDLGQSYLRPRSGMVAAGGQYVDPTKSDMAPVTDLILERLPFTLQLGAVALVFALLLSFPVGIAGGLRPDGWPNKLAFGLQSLFVSIPNFWLAIVLILFLSVKLNLLPALGYQGFSYVLLPALVLSVEIAPFIIRTLTTSFGEVMQAPFIDEARVRGLSRRRIVYAHALRNAAVPLVNLLGIQLSTLIGGVLVIEYIFDYPGLGNLTVVSVVGRDFPVIQGIAITTSAVFVFINIIVDLVAYLIDPRVEL